MIVPFLSIYIF